VPDGRRIEALYNYPVFAFDCGEAPSDSDRRIEALAEMLDIYASTEGNNARRFSIMEAAALALGRALGARGDYDRALASVVLRNVGASHWRCLVSSRLEAIE